MQVLETMSFEKNWANPKNDLVDPHRTKNGQNAPSCTGVSRAALVTGHKDFFLFLRFPSI